MANIRVDLDYTIKDGSSVVFRSPCDCTQITGLIVYYKSEEGTQTSCTFSLADAHGENVGDIPHLFAENVVVKVILDITNGMAFVQNADTNSYLEAHINNEGNPHNVTAEQVGARPNTWMPTAQDVGALPSTYTPPNQTAAQVGADPAGTAESKVSAHNTKNDAHNDIRLLIAGLTSRLDALANSDDDTLDQMAEVVAYIKANRDLIQQITTGKVSVSDIINNLTTNVSNKPLSAAQGVALKALIDGLSSGKLDASKLTEAINTALAQAKASGEFNGAKGDPGTSVTVKSVSESTADGGNNVVTFSDGKTVTIKNGSKGSTGATGDKGDKGDAGSRGFSVLRITTAPSGYTTATGGFTPTYRVALSTVLSQSKSADVVVGDTIVYSYYTYPVGYVDASYVYLGARVSIRGATGAAGTSPVKGTDYWTPADQEAIVQQVISALGTPVFGTVDADNNIILTGGLADGTYTLKYEDAEGNVVEVGTISTIETSGEIPVTLTMGKIDSSTGAITTSDNMLYSQAIPVESGKKYRLVANGICGGFKIAYYNSADQFISCTSSNLAASESGQLINVDVEVPIISSASYFRLRVSALWYNGGYTDAIALLRNNVRLLWERT